jgi:plasmid stabilization system protein ParE
VIYRLTILPRAKRQLLEQALWWCENRSADQACRWLDGFEQALASLANDPKQCSRARETNAFHFEVRELHYGLQNKATHRAVFEIRSDEVIVYSIRHLAQRDLEADDL